MTKIKDTQRKNRDAKIIALRKKQARELKDIVINSAETVEECDKYLKQYYEKKKVIEEGLSEINSDIEKIKRRRKQISG